MEIRAPATPRRNESVPRKLPTKILLLTLLPIVAGIGTSILLVEREVKQLIASETEVQLRSGRNLALEFLEARSEALLSEAWAVARDPGFVSLLDTPEVENETNPGSELEESASRFGHSVASDWMEVLNERGEVLASWRPASHRVEQPPTNSRDGESYALDVREALSGYAATDMRENRSGQMLQVATVPVRSGNRLVGALRHGRVIDATFLERIHDLTRCEVAFLNGTHIRIASTDAIDHSQSVVTKLPNLDAEASYSLGLYRSMADSESFMATLRRNLLLIGLVALVAGLLLARQVVRHLSHPVEQLVQAAVRLEHDRDDLPIDIRTGDEMEYLGRRFEEMRSALRRQIQSLRELDRMKSTFLTIASHELRTPTTVISGNADLLESAESKDDPLYKEGMEGIRRGVDRLRGVLGRISDMSLIDSQSIQLATRAVSSDELNADLLLEWAHISQGRDLKFVEATPPAPVWIWADSRLLRQALVNILHNAARFTPDGGSVWLHIEDTGGRVQIRIEDTGIGVAVEDYERIFDTFYETVDVLQHSSGDHNFGSSGMGLGLAICRSIVEAHKGSVRYEPRSGGGSRFVVELPRHEMKGGAGRADSAAA